MIEDAEQLERQADELRACGQLEAAAERYFALLRIQPGHLKAERLLASISGLPAQLPSSPGGLKPAPFVLVHDFLPSDVHDALLTCLLSKVAEFEPAETDEGLRLDSRRSLMLAHCFTQVPAEIGQAFQSRLLASWPRTRERLRLTDFDLCHFETHALLYADGDFFTVHCDTGRRNTRRVTFVYNLQRTPRQFQGGDLLLYDTYFPSRPGMSVLSRFANSCTRLRPEDNRLVFFPSEFYHRVTPVSGVGGDWTRARMAINGWFHTTPGHGDIDQIALTPY